MGSTISFVEFQTVAEIRAANSLHERRGQALFNALYEVRPDVANRLRGSMKDSFYRDERIGVFYDEVQKLW